MILMLRFDLKTRPTMSLHFQLRKKKIMFRAMFAFFSTEFPFQNPLTVFPVHKKVIWNKIPIPDGPNINGKHTRRLHSRSTEGFSYHTFPKFKLWHKVKKNISTQTLFAGEKKLWKEQKEDFEEKKTHSKPTNLFRWEKTSRNCTL